MTVDDLHLAITLTQAMIKGKSMEELSRLHLLLQTMSSLVSAELGCLRLGDSFSPKSNPDK